MSDPKKSSCGLIPPTVGRQVEFYPAPHFSVAGAPGPLAATIVHVHSDRMINVAVYDSNGKQFAVTSCVLVQPGDDVDAGQNRCEWMPYQKGQAAKTEAAEAALKNAKTGCDTKTDEGRLKKIVEGRDVAANPGKELGAKEACDDKAATDCDKAADPPEAPASSWVKK